MKFIVLLAMVISLLIPSTLLAVSPIGGGSALATANAEASSNSGGNSQSYSSPSIPMQPQALFPYLQQLLPGQVVDITNDAAVPDLYVIDKLQKGEKVVSVVSYTRGGRIAGFTRIEDFEEDLITLIPKAMMALGQENTGKMRFKVILKMSSKSIGVGGGGGGSMGGFSGGASPVAMGANAAVLPGVSINTSDPKLVIKFYVVK